MPTNPTHKDDGVSGFQREERYIVVKRKNLNAVQETALREEIARLQIGTVECVVVESDWPEYEPAWQMIEARVTGRAQPAGLVEALATANIVEIVKDGRWSLSLKFGTAGEMRAASDAIRAALTSSDSPVVGEDCTCQRHPTHCANDCPQHGLSEPTYTAGERIDIPPTPTDTADRREAVAREIIARVVDRCRKLDDYANRRAWEKILSEEIQASLIAEPATSASLGEDRREAIARIIRQYCQHGVEPEPFGGSLDTADLAIASLLPKIPEGWVVVPREPTEAMLRKGHQASDDFMSFPGMWSRTNAVWSAMLSAATPPSVGEGGGA